MTTQSHIKSDARHSPDNSILRWWQRLTALPAGTWLFSRFLGWYAPYSGSIGARVEALSAGHARVSLRDRRRVRNHLKSVHAIAIMNLGEIAPGLAVLSCLPASMRGIVTELRAEYLKKSRGRLVASSEFELPSTIEDNTPCEAKTEIRDEADDVVAIVRATWLLGYKN